MARRSFLRGCGGSAVLLLPLLRSIEARAQGMAAPLRFLVIHHPLGAAPGLGTWRPAAAATTTNYVLPADSSPFAPLQSKMVMIDGLNLVTASKAAGNNGGSYTHEGGMVALMTGVPTLGTIGQADHCAGGPSMDQLLLARSAALGGAAATADKRTPFGSLQLAADIRSDRDEIAPRVLSYAPPTTNTDINLARQPLYAETQPLTTFNRIFGGALPTGTNTAALLANRLSVLDFMRSDLARLQTLIPASEKPKLDTHAAAIQQLESSLRATLGSSTTGPTCVKPTAPTNFTQSGTGPNSSTGNAPAGGASKLSGVDYFLPNDSTNHPHQLLGQAHLSLIRAAFACDLVRVATFMWSSGTNWVVFPGTFNGATIKGNLQSTPHHPPSHSDPAGDTATRDWLNQINLFYSQQTSLALQAFDGMRDIDGNTLLDNTIVVYVTEVARAWDHNQMGMPLIIFGGKNTKLKGGTFVKVTGGPLSAQTGVNTSGGTGNRPFNDFWLALAPVFGVPMTSLGNANQFTSPLAGIFA
jgi:Protein of unknown function (DUF1552)